MCNYCHKIDLLFCTFTAMQTSFSLSCSPSFIAINNIVVKKACCGNRIFDMLQWTQFDGKILTLRSFQASFDFFAFKMNIVEAIIF